jgi:pheromone shutdown protein TraB
MITIIGVGHVFAISENLRSIIQQRRPQLVCLELDPARYQALLSKERSGSVPIQYMLLALFQSRIADKYGTEVGGEMLAAAGAAHEVGAKVALIDMDASMVFAKLWKRMSLKEKVHLLGGAFVGLFVSKKTVERELDKYQGNEEVYLETLGAGFPSIKEVLIDDRNSFMADRLTSLAKEYSNIVAIVGDGHVSGIAQRLGGLEVETVRLRDVRSGVQATTEGASASATFYYRTEP